MRVQIDEEEKENGYAWKRLEEKYLRLLLKYCICGCIKNIQNWHSSLNPDTQDDHDDRNGHDDHEYNGGGRGAFSFLLKCHECLFQEVYGYGYDDNDDNDDENEW